MSAPASGKQPSPRRIPKLHGTPPLETTLHYAGRSQDSWGNVRQIRCDLERRGVELPKLQSV